MADANGPDTGQFGLAGRTRTDTRRGHCPADIAAQPMLQSRYCTAPTRGRMNRPGKGAQEAHGSDPRRGSVTVTSWPRVRMLQPPAAKTFFTQSVSEP